MSHKLKNRESKLKKKAKNCIDNGSSLQSFSTISFLSLVVFDIQIEVQKQCMSFINNLLLSALTRILQCKQYEVSAVVTATKRIKN